MSERERGRSPELDQVRQMLFPELSPAEGWARIDEAMTGASDPEKWDRVEDLASDLLRRLRPDDDGDAG
jgi:hypothetical protein